MNRATCDSDEELLLGGGKLGQLGTAQPILFAELNLFFSFFLFGKIALVDPRIWVLSACVYPGVAALLCGQKYFLLYRQVLHSYMVI